MDVKHWHGLSNSEVSTNCATCANMALAAVFKPVTHCKLLVERVINEENPDMREALVFGCLPRHHIIFAVRFETI